MDLALNNLVWLICYKTKPIPLGNNKNKNKGKIVCVHVCWKVTLFRHCIFIVNRIPLA